MASTSLNVSGQSSPERRDHCWTRSKLISTRASHSAFDIVRSPNELCLVPSGDTASPAKPALRWLIVPAWLAGTFAHEGTGGGSVRRRFGLLTHSDSSLIYLTATNTPRLDLHLKA